MPRARVCKTSPVEEWTTTTTANGRLAMMAIIGMFFHSSDMWLPSMRLAEEGRGRYLGATCNY